MTAQQPYPATAALSAFAAGLSVEAMPEAARRAIRTSFADQLGVILAAGTLGHDSLAFVDYARSVGGQGASLLGLREQATPAFAAFANGALAHALDFEETHDASLVHPSASVMPAVLALAEVRGASGADVMAALCAGSEVTCRIAQAFVGNPQEGSHFFILPHVGAIGAAVGAGRILGLDADRMGHAIALAIGMVVNTAAVLADPDTSVREVRDGHNAKAGVLAAELAARGVTGARGVLETRHGYFDMFGGGHFDTSAFADLGGRFDCAALSFKPWPACRGAHVFIDMALDMRAERGLAPADIARIELGVSPFFETLCLPRELRAAPPSEITAKFSIPFAVATALAIGEVGLGSFGPEARANATTGALARKVSHEVLDLPQSRSTEGRLALVLTDGTRLEARRDVPPGHPLRPLSPEALAAKFTACAALAPCPPTPADCARILEATGRLEMLEDISRDLTALL